MKRAIITDLDGTLSIASNRRYSEFERVITDTPDPIVREVLHGLTQANNAVLIAMTGRPDVGNCREDSRRWIEDIAQLPLELLLMRKPEDYSPDALVKQRLFHEYVLGLYSIDLVLEDKPSVVRMWRGEGLRCFEVADNEKSRASIPLV